MHYQECAPPLSPSPSFEPSLSDLARQMVLAKAASGRRSAYVESLGWMVRHFVRWLTATGLPVVPSSITREVLERYVDGATPSLRSARLARVSVFCTWMTKLRIMPRNPCRELEHIRIDRGRVHIWTPEQCARVLADCRVTMRAGIALGLFSGLRPSEAHRLDWSAIRLTGAGPCVTVDAAAAKTRRRRIVPLQPAALSWLALDAKAAGPVMPVRNGVKCAHERTLRMGIKWHADVLRHTYASMRVAAGVPVGQVALEMGNSEQVLLTHYRELVTPEDAERFWALRPRSG